MSYPGGAPELQNLLIAYFGDPEYLGSRIGEAEVVDEYVATQPVSVVEQTIVQIRELLGTPTPMIEIVERDSNLDFGDEAALRFWLSNISELLNKKLGFPKS